MKLRVSGPAQFLDGRARYTLKSRFIFFVRIRLAKTGKFSTRPTYLDAARQRSGEVSKSPRPPHLDVAFVFARTCLAVGPIFNLIRQVCRFIMFSQIFFILVFQQNNLQTYVFYFLSCVFHIFCCIFFRKCDETCENFQNHARRIKIFLLKNS